MDILWLFLIVFFILLAITPAPLDESYNSNFYVTRSRISGLGLFSSLDRLEGDILLQIISERKRVTRLGSRVNHCWTPNTRVVYFSGQGWWLVASKNIAANAEVTADYREGPSFVRMPKANYTC